MDVSLDVGAEDYRGVVQTRKSFVVIMQSAGLFWDVFITNTNVVMIRYALLDIRVVEGGVMDEVGQRVVLGMGPVVIHKIFSLMD